MRFLELHDNPASPPAQPPGAAGEPQEQLNVVFVKFSVFAIRFVIRLVMFFLFIFVSGVARHRVSVWLSVCSLFELSLVELVVYRVLASSKLEYAVCRQLMAKVFAYRSCVSIDFEFNMFAHVLCLVWQTPCVGIRLLTSTLRLRTRVGGVLHCITCSLQHQVACLVDGHNLFKRETMSGIFNE